MLSWLKRLFRRRPDGVAPGRRPKAPASPVSVEHDEKTIAVDDGTGNVTTLAWADLASVTIVTTDAGPFEADLFWLLTDRSGRQATAIPMGAAGETDLLHAMQARLAGFDNMAVVEAMGSVTGAVFQIWPAVDPA